MLHKENKFEKGKVLSTRKLIFGGLLASTIMFSGIVAGASTMNLSAPVIRSNVPSDVIPSNNKKVLIYHSHTSERNVDSSVVDIGNDLTEKLEKKGFQVTHLTQDFIQGDYNHAYRHSRAVLETLNLNDYVLTIDLHMDACSVPVKTNVNGVDVAKLMFVTTSQNPYLPQEKEIIQGLRDNLNKFSTDIVRDETTHYRYGINHYNLGMSNNMILIEFGDDKNTYIETKRSCTLLASAIDTYFKDKY